MDTSWLVALIDKRDQNQARAMELVRTLEKEAALLISTDAVIGELCNYFARSPLRTEAISWVEELRDDAGWDIVPVDRALLARAEARYRLHDDKSWSLTDCIGMELMDARRVKDAATTDMGFKQAGFRVLLASSEGTR